MKGKTRATHTKKIFITAKQIRQRVKLLAERISKDYADKDLFIIPVLKGSVIFFSDLIRNIKINSAVDFISVSSYNGIKSTGKISVLNDLKVDPAGKDVLLVEDIVDTGYTLNYLRKDFLSRKPASIKTCVLLDKVESRKIPVKIDYKGFTIPNEFVVGYGLDYLEKYRGLPHISILKFKE